MSGSTNEPRLLGTNWLGVWAPVTDGSRDPAQTGRPPPRLGWPSRAEPGWWGAGAPRRSSAARCRVNRLAASQGSPGPVTSVTDGRGLLQGRARAGAGRRWPPGRAQGPPSCEDGRSALPSSHGAEPRRRVTARSPINLFKRFTRPGGPGGGGAAGWELQPRAQSALVGRPSRPAAERFRRGHSRPCKQQGQPRAATWTPAPTRTWALRGHRPRWPEGHQMSRTREDGGEPAGGLKGTGRSFFPRGWGSGACHQHDIAGAGL